MDASCNQLEDAILRVIMYKSFLSMVDTSYRELYATCVETQCRTYEWMHTCHRNVNRWPIIANRRPLDKILYRTVIAISLKHEIQFGCCCRLRETRPRLFNFIYEHREVKFMKLKRRCARNSNLCRTMLNEIFFEKSNF